MDPKHGLKGEVLYVLIPFLAGLWFGLPFLGGEERNKRLNPLFGGSVVWTDMADEFGLANAS